MAKYTPNGIYTYIRNYVKNELPTVYVTGEDEPVPNQGASVKIREIGRYQPRRNITLAYDDEQYSIAYQADVYSNLFNDHAEEAYEIMHVVEQAFKQLYFIETSCTPVERTDNRVARLTARFERQIGSGDNMPD